MSALLPQSGKDWIGNDGKLVRGKYKGKYVEDAPRGYLVWILNETDISDGDAVIIQAHLARKS